MCVAFTYIVRYPVDPFDPFVPSLLHETSGSCIHRELAFVAWICDCLPGPEDADLCSGPTAAPAWGRRLRLRLCTCLPGRLPGPDLPRPGNTAVLALTHYILVQFVSHCASAFATVSRSTIMPKFTRLVLALVPNLYEGPQH